MKEKCAKILRKLTGKKYIYFTNRGNSSILLAMRFAKHLNFSKIYLPYEGGWITYPQYAKKLKFEIEYIPTNDSYISLNKLRIDNNSIIILNTMAAYSVLLDARKFTRRIEKKNCFFINDVSASIGTDQSFYGDLIIGSFGKGKPINVEYGGFIATDDETFEEFYNQNFNKEIEDFYEKLYEQLINLKDRLEMFEKRRKQVIEDLHEYDIIYREKKGINVLVKFHNKEEKENLIKYCEEKNIEHTLCPRDIRVKCDAISIEIKRL